MEKIQSVGYGKINLTLDVVGKRNDGYHEVEMIMQSIAVVDILTLEKDSRITIASNRDAVPTNDSNLVYKVAVALKEYTGYKGGAHVFIEKNIPIAAGLAGGSADAAAALKGLNRLWQLDLSERELMQIGAKLGADIPFCIIGGTALAKGKGEELTPLRDLPELHLLLVKPPMGVSTKEVYEKLKISEIQKRPSTTKILKAIKEGNANEIINNLGNVLETVTLKMHPEIQKIKDKLLEHGAQSTLMSGSGPTVFAVVEGLEKGIEIAQKIKKETSYKDVEVILTKTIGR